MEIWRPKEGPNDEKPESPQGEEGPGPRPFIWGAAYRGLKRGDEKVDADPDGDLRG
jgi:hypothetical protein